MKRTILFLIGITLLSLLLWKGDFTLLLSSLVELKWTTLFFLCFLQVVTIGLLNYQWLSIAKPFFPSVTYHSMLKIQMIGTLVESVTPAAKTGGEAVKAMLFKKTFQSTYGNAVSLISIQKLCSMTTFIPMACFSIIYMFLHFNNLPISIIVGSFLFVFSSITLLLAITLKVSTFKKVLLKKTPTRKWGTSLLSFINSFEEGVERLGKNKGIVGLQLILSFLIWTLFPVKAYLISSSLQLDVPFLTIFSITLLAYMIAMLPLTPGGLGTFEGSTIFLLGLAEIGLTEALLFAILLRFVTFWFVFIVSSLYCGIALFPKDKRKHVLVPSKETV
ncbi:lysylphosphatidylglycerol synthase transmembrane domain-containing protein [Evansella sp. AB-P1]|uniref:lysylphosphatidylglycerol synthase transmembrane domain-containing protein n=1 Tax=Evansella sp. AB-P1 TaxID=3037653 RepID=UPI00241D192E|nr:lysylphosphatidylglycerol synthase transmembrane domain-containing protein [Evansella sp. AB-P1]MDG5788041.1 lysylphosphatidylglycerol synthase transmembrane domain-containing protein [Evansella sp. AB-P1]